jgi:bacterioferritin
MPGSSEIVELLNEVLTGELTAINQYFVDSKMFANWGFERLASKFREESMGEMNDAEELIDRILYLDGMPNLQRLSPVRVGESGAEKLQLALDLERAAIDRLNRGIAACTAASDNGSRELLEGILEGEEGHADWLETQLELIRQVGDAHYLAQQIKE